MTASSGNPFSASSRSLDPREVHLWLCDRDAAGLDLSVLDAEERSRAARWQGEGDSDFALGRAWLRQLLSEYAGSSPNDWRFATGVQGKPALVAPASAAQFNLSHSGRWLAVVLSRDVPVGVDVQEVDDGRPLRSLARRYFSGPEREAMANLEGEDFTRHFFRLWALKEAWTKARGESLPAALGATAFGFRGGELISLTPDRTRDNSLWLMEVAGYALAVCGLARGLSLRCWRWTSPGTAAPFEPSFFAACGVP